jgi:hypothetical protein
VTLVKGHKPPISLVDQGNAAVGGRGVVARGAVVRSDTDSVWTSA